MILYIDPDFENHPTMRLISFDITGTFRSNHSNCMRPLIWIFLLISAVTDSPYSQTWHALGDGLNGSVSVLVVHENELYAGGSFTDAGNDPEADFIAKWNGNNWEHVAPGLFGPVQAIAFSGNDIYVGGGFPPIGSDTTKKYIARWDGTTWHSLGTGVNKPVYAIAVNGNKIYVGGWFSNVGGIESADHIALWENNGWHALGSGIVPFNIGVYTIAVDGNDLYAGGNFYSAGGADNTFNVARWDGNSWHSLGNGFWGDMGAIAIAVNEHDVFVGGDGGSVDTFSCGVARWDGSIWHPLGSGLSNCLYGEGAWAIVKTENKLYVGGIFENAGGVSNTECLAKWDGQNWSALGVPGLNPDAFNPVGIYAMAVHGNDVYVGGVFPNIGGVDGTVNIARWHEIETSYSEVQGHAEQLEVFPNPTGGILTYQIRYEDIGQHKVRFFNHTGEIVHMAVSQNQFLDISHLVPGMYFMCIESNRFSMCKKIIRL